MCDICNVRTTWNTPNESMVDSDRDELRSRLNTKNK